MDMKLNQRIRDKTGKSIYCNTNQGRDEDNPLHRENNGSIPSERQQVSGFMPIEDARMDGARPRHENGAYSREA